MDRFDLNWPKTDAIFYTDGWRCRIVWRQKGGPGGTIDNNVQCVRRVARSLEGAPYLLSALKARGHDRLASQIESEAALEGIGSQPDAVETKPPVDVMASWLAGLTGSVDFEAAKNRRASTWIELGALGEETLFLKVPAVKGKQEWVLKRTREDAKKKAAYVAAPSFRGMASWLAAAGAKPSFVERLFAACAAVEHEELVHAAAAWRQAQQTATH